MIIDNQGKLFGKVNIIDLFVLIVLVGAIAFIATKGFLPSIAKTTNAQTYEMKFYVEEVPDYVADIIQVGGVVEDEQKSIKLGTITNVEKQPGYMFVPNADGELIKSVKEGYASCEITSELSAQAFENGIMVDGNKYSVGHSFVIRADKSKIYLKISAIELKGE